MHLLLQADARRIPLADRSAHCVVTSPPYWGLRDYRVDGQIGLERTPDAFVSAIVAVFREVRRVLRDDGTLWLNLGDSYCNDARGGIRPSANLGKDGRYNGKASVEVLLPPKNLIGIPWRVALALQADGWYLRSDIIWAKPNPMPESVADRPTKAHEYLFLMAKSERYFYDADAVREPTSGGAHTIGDWGSIRRASPRDARDTHEDCGSLDPTGRNLRSVWSIPTEAYPGAHFATFPRKLVEPCIRAGTSERGCCPGCGAPWGRVVEREFMPTQDPRFPKGGLKGVDESNGWGEVPRGRINSTTVGWQPTCPHDLDPVPCVVLDPFAGSGTTLQVAESLGRRGIGLDLSRDYLGLAARRIGRPHARTPRPGREEHMPLFAGGDH